MKRNIDRIFLKLVAYNRSRQELLDGYSIFLVISIFGYKINFQRGIVSSPFLKRKLKGSLTWGRRNTLQAYCKLDRRFHLREMKTFFARWRKKIKNDLIELPKNDRWPWVAANWGLIMGSFESLNKVASYDNACIKTVFRQISMASTSKIKLSKNKCYPHRICMKLVSIDRSR